MCVSYGAGQWRVLAGVPYSAIYQPATCAGCFFTVRTAAQSRGLPRQGVADPRTLKKI